MQQCPICLLAAWDEAETMAVRARVSTRDQEVLDGIVRSMEGLRCRALWWTGWGRGGGVFERGLEEGRGERGVGFVWSI